MTNEARGQLATRRVDRHAEDHAGTGVVIPGVVDFGRASAGNDRHDHTRMEMGDTLAVASQRHFLKAGVTVTRIAVSGEGVDGAGGMFAQDQAKHY